MATITDLGSLPIPVSTFRSIIRNNSIALRDETEGYINSEFYSDVNSAEDTLQSIIDKTGEWTPSQTNTMLARVQNQKNIITSDTDPEEAIGENDFWYEVLHSQ